MPNRLGGAPQPLRTDIRAVTRLSSPHYDAAMRWKAHGVACAVVAVLGTTLTACGSGVSVSVATLSSSSSTSTAHPTPGADSADLPDATTVVHDARAAYGAATSAHMHASIQDEGRTQTVDIRGSMDGSNQELTITDPANGTATVRTVDGKHYVKGDRTFWEKSAKADGTTAGLLTDKWVLANGMSTKDLEQLTIRNVLDDMIGPDAVSDSDTEHMRTYRATEQDIDLYVALAVDPTTQDVDTLKVDAATPHNVTEVTGTSDTGQGDSAAFDGWNTQPQVTVPKGYLTFPGSGPTGGPTI